MKGNKVRIRSNLLYIIYLAIFLISPFSIPAQAQDIAPQRGALYRITHEGNTAHLFGTIHVGHPGFYPLEPRVLDALAQANTIGVELDIRNQEAFQQAVRKYGLYPGNQGLEQHLSATTLARLRQTLQRYKVPVENVRRMKPWMVANLLLVVALEQQGYSSTYAIEHFLLAQASAQAKPVVELENAAYQLALFDKLSRKQQEQYLLEVLAEIESGQAMDEARRLIAAWGTADSQQLDTLLRESRNENSLTARFIHRTLLDQRNPVMADKVEKLLRNNKNSFVGVGLMHLLGEGGIPDLLRRRGYQVEKLY